MLLFCPVSPGLGQHMGFSAEGPVGGEPQPRSQTRCSARHPAPRGPWGLCPDQDPSRGVSCSPRLVCWARGLENDPKSNWTDGGERSDSEEDARGRRGAPRRPQAPAPSRWCRGHQASAVLGTAGCGVRVYPSSFAAQRLLPLLPAPRPQSSVWNTLTSCFVVLR